MKLKEHNMPVITDDVIAVVIELARLDPLAPGMSMYKHHLSRILEHFKVLSKVQVDGVDPTIHINPTPIPLREDKVLNWLSQEEALANTRVRTDEFFRAPSIHDEGD
jgi:aspartyl-tRNA(Asn)/glutamyl-tRNA(Gln) amidotransferase subunit C